jgi:hypothetical protein
MVHLTFLSTAAVSQDGTPVNLNVHVNVHVNVNETPGEFTFTGGGQPVFNAEGRRYALERLRDPRT